MSAHALLLVASLSTLAIGAAGAAPQGNILHVGNHGADSAGCGSPEQPCRTIGRAIVNAAEGDTILVGPGLYGDINRDNDFNDPGDEPAEPLDRHCVICIDKRVRILSTHGADATRIESLTNLFDNIESELTAMVAIDAEGVTFGAPKHGFELAGKPGFLVLVRQGGNITVAGNVADRLQAVKRDLEVSAEIGFVVRTAGGLVRLIGNTARTNHFGFSISGNGPVILIDNVALENTWEGFSIGGPATHRLFGNVASGNGGALRAPSENPQTGQPVFPGASGFTITTGASTLAGNIAIGNYGPGFRILTSASSKGVLRARANAASGNGGAGFLIENDGPGGTIEIQENNIFGNLGAETGCGLINASGKNVDARFNFWGAATGPGEDPADKAGPGTGCDQGQGSVTSVTPFATEPFAINPRGRQP